MKGAQRAVPIHVRAASHRIDMADDTRKLYLEFAESCKSKQPDVHDEDPGDGEPDDEAPRGGTVVGLWQVITADHQALAKYDATQDGTLQYVSDVTGRGADEDEVDDEQDGNPENGDAAAEVEPEAALRPPALQPRRAQGT